ncbi:MAG: hypothetical protein Q9195_007366 [Heterodermia aff. obscurata]
MHKLVVYWFRILQLTFVGTAVATPTSQPQPRNVSIGPATEALSTLPDLPRDEEFATLLNEYPYQLQDIPVFMAAVIAMRDLGARDFEEGNLPETSWSHPLFPGVKLTVRPPLEQRLLSVRFAMWIIMYTTRCLVHEKHYSGEYLSLYKLETIGYMVIRPTVAIARQGNSSTQRTQSNDAYPFPNNSSTQTFSVGTAANDDMRATVKYVGTNIDRADFFLILLWISLNLAPHIEEPLTVWRTTSIAGNSEITTIWNRVKPPAGSPQYGITKGDLLVMFAHLPEICLRDRRFQEMNIEITYSGVVIARGLVRIKPALGLPSGPLIVNDTIA